MTQSLAFPTFNLRTDHMHVNLTPLDTVTGGFELDIWELLGGQNNKDDLIFLDADESGLYGAEVQSMREPVILRLNPIHPEFSRGSLTFTAHRTVGLPVNAWNPPKWVLTVQTPFDVGILFVPKRETEYIGTMKNVLELFTQLETNPGNLTNLRPVLELVMNSLHVVFLKFSARDIPANHFHFDTVEKFFNQFERRDNAFDLIRGR